HVRNLGKSFHWSQDLPDFPLTAVDRKRRSVGAMAVIDPKRFLRPVSYQQSTRLSRRDLPGLV
ncbi:hypothetical protein ABTL20_21280, partial [Acinetobacter baumannii]